MFWIVLGCLVLGLGLCAIAGFLASCVNPDNRTAAPFYALPGIVLVIAAGVLAIGNTVVQALL